MAWEYETFGPDGQCKLFGVNIFDYDWQTTGKRVKVKDPIYHQDHTFEVWQVEIDGQIHRFAAGEFSNCVWGFYENRKEPGADREAAEANAGEMRMEQKVIYNGQILTLTRFWATGEPCLWITDPQQIEMPKMEFVGGHPDEYCIFLKNLTETELAQITSLDGAPLDVKEELSDIE